MLTGAPFTDGPPTRRSSPTSRPRWTGCEIPQAEKDRLIAAAREALTGPFRRGYEAMLATLAEVEPRARGNNGAWSLPDGAAYYAQRLRQSTTTDLTAEQIHHIGLDQVAPHPSARWSGSSARSASRGTLTQFFAHINAGQEFKYPNTAEGREHYLADAPRASSRR